MTVVAVIKVSAYDYTNKGGERKQGCSFSYLSPSPDGFDAINVMCSLEQASQFPKPTGLYDIEMTNRQLRSGLSMIIFHSAVYLGEIDLNFASKYRQTLAKQQSQQTKVAA
jgi:hypothetical protein